MPDQMDWCAKEFSNIELGDKRLNARFIKVSSDLLKNSRSSIIAAAQTLKGAKGAYRLFDNAKLIDKKIINEHQDQTLNRLSDADEEVCFAIQDTTTLNYTHHPKKSGLCKLHKKAGFDKALMGCFLHNTLLITASGKPLGLIDQKIYTHKANLISNKQRPITEKESYRWIESLEKTTRLCGAKKPITICDRESDIYEFFVKALELDAKVLVRASFNRIVFGNKNTAHDTLWPYMKKQKVATTITIDAPKRNHSSQRKATLNVRYAEIEVNPPTRTPKAQLEKLKKITLNAIWFKEDTDAEDALSWMLLTNIDIKETEDAVRVGQWYKLRWQIECFHRVLKSGCDVENCRLETFERLKRYLTLKSIIAYRLFYLSLISRVDPKKPCDNILAEYEWKALICYINKNPKPPSSPPNVSEAIYMIARLGGFPGRKGDGPPGMTTIWRGWNKLTEIARLWQIMAGETCG